MKKKRQMLSKLTLNYIEIQRKIAKFNEKNNKNLFGASSESLTRRSLKLKNHSVGSRDFFYRFTASDLGVLRQIFIAEDYSLRSLNQKERIQLQYDAILASGKSPLILDCGSNIGASAVWFADAFPKAEIVCFEPDPDNFELLKRNTQGLNVELHKAAVGSTTENCNLTGHHLGAWGLRTVPDANGQTSMIGILDYIKPKIAKNYVPFLAKIDIEGGEADLFLEADQWAHDFPLIIIELHDWLMPGELTSHPFLAFAAKYKRDFVHIGENIFSIRL